MPKMQTTTAGDEMFILDNSFFYWDFLSGTKFLRYASLVNAAMFRYCAQCHIGASAVLESYLFQWLPFVCSTFLFRTIPNAEHSCVGHFSSLLLNVRAFYCRMLEVSENPWQWYTFMTHFTFSQPCTAHTVDGNYSLLLTCICICRCMWPLWVGI